MDKPKRILYRGVPMIEGWPEKIQEAQQIPSYTSRDNLVLAFDTEVNTKTGMQTMFPAMTVEF